MVPSRALASFCIAVIADHALARLATVPRSDGVRPAACPNRTPSHRAALFPDPRRARTVYGTCNRSVRSAAVVGVAVTRLQGDCRRLRRVRMWMSPRGRGDRRHGRLLPAESVHRRTASAVKARPVLGGSRCISPATAGSKSTSLRDGGSRVFSSSVAHYAGGATAVLPLDAADGPSSAWRRRRPRRGRARSFGATSGPADATHRRSGVHRPSVGDRALLLMKADGRISILLVMRASGVWRSTDDGRTLRDGPVSGLPAAESIHLGRRRGRPARRRRERGGLAETNSGASWSIARAGSAPTDLPPLAVGAVGGGNGVLLATIERQHGFEPRRLPLDERRLDVDRPARRWARRPDGEPAARHARRARGPRRTRASSSRRTAASTWQARNTGLTNLTVNNLADAGRDRSSRRLPARRAASTGRRTAARRGRPADLALFANRDVSVLAAVGPKVFAGGIAGPQLLERRRGDVDRGVQPAREATSRLSRRRGRRLSSTPRVSAGTYLYRTSDMFQGWQAMYPPLAGGHRDPDASPSAARTSVAGAGQALYRSMGGAFGFALAGRPVPVAGRARCRSSRSRAARSGWPSAGPRGRSTASSGAATSGRRGPARRAGSPSPSRSTTSRPQARVSMPARAAGPYVSDDGGAHLGARLRGRARPARCAPSSRRAERCTSARPGRAFCLSRRSRTRAGSCRWSSTSTRARRGTRPT